MLCNHSTDAHSINHRRPCSTLREGRDNKRIHLPYFKGRETE